MPQSTLDSLLTTSPRASASEWATALLEAEAKAKRDRLELPVAKFLGNWRLYYVTTGKVNLKSKRRRGFQLPQWLPAMISFAENPNPISPLCITNQITIAGIHIQFTGPARHQTKKNLLAFDFTHCVVTVFGIQVYSGAVPSPTQGKVFNEVPIGKLPFFAFFQVSDRLIAARGRGGGLAVWVKTITQ